MERLPRQCYLEKKNGWPRPPTAERKTRPYSNILGARRRQKRRGKPKKTWRSTFKEDLEEMGVSWHGASRFDRDRWRLVIAQCSASNRRNKIRVSKKQHSPCPCRGRAAAYTGPPAPVD